METVQPPMTDRSSTRFRRWAPAALAVGMGLAWAACALGQNMPALPDPIEVRKTVGPKVCLVRADGPLGVPEAYASGFLLGAGRFVITDLAAVARRGVEQATISFADGTSIVTDKFGMADPATGLVALAVPEGKERAGLSLSTASGADNGGVPAVVVGWQYAESQEVVTGRLVNGITSAEAGGWCKVQPPAGAPTFLTVYAAAKPMATGAPAVDASGGVVGVVVHLRGVDPVVAVPAGALRRALLSAQPSLKPLRDLPRPVWPVTVDCLQGKPVTPQAFAGSVRAVKMQSRCSKCRGTGKVMVKKVVGQQRVGGMTRNIVRTEAETCRTCGGDGIIFGRGLYDDYVRMAEGATRLASDPAVGENVLGAAVENISSLLDALSRVSGGYRNELADHGARDLARLKNKFPHGVVVYAQCLDTVDHKGRSYTYLSPVRSNVRLLAAADDLVRPLGDTAAKKAAGPRPGDWIVLVGLARGSVAVGNQKALYLEMFGWDWGPVLGPIPDYLRKGGVGDSSHPRPQPPPRKKGGATTFFGL